MVTTSNAKAAFSKWGWYGLPGGPNPAAVEIVTPGRFGGKALEMGSSSVASGDTQMSYLLPESYSGDVWFQGAAMYTSSAHDYLKQFLGIGFNGVCLFCLAMADFGVIELWRGRPYFGGTKIAQSAGGTYYFDTWNYLELGGLIVNSTAGYITVRLNTVPVIQLVSTNTNPTGLLPAFNSVMVGFLEDIGVGGGDTDCKWDDMYLTDDAGTLNNSWLGNVRCQAQVAASNATPITWTPFPALTPNWQAASNTAIDDTTYVFTNTISNTDLYNVTPIVSAPEIFGVSVRGAYRQTDATQRSVANVLESNGTLVEGHEFFTPGTYAFSSDIFETDPDTGLAWLYTAVNLIKIGPRLKS